MNCPKLVLVSNMIKLENSLKDGKRVRMKSIEFVDADMHYH